MLIIMNLETKEEKAMSLSPGGCYGQKDPSVKKIGKGGVRVVRVTGWTQLGGHVRIWARGRLLE